MDINLAGIMIWSVDTDDFHGDCISKNGNVSTNYPLMKAITRTISEVIKVRQDNVDDNQLDYTDNNTGKDDKDDSGAETLKSMIFVVAVMTVLQHFLK